jgi:hypothetical protein
MKNAKECEPSGLDANRAYASNISAQPDTKLEIQERTKSYEFYVHSCLPTFGESLLDPSSTIKEGFKIWVQTLFCAYTYVYVEN